MRGCTPPWMGRIQEDACDWRLGRLGDWAIYKYELRMESKSSGCSIEQDGEDQRMDKLGHEAVRALSGLAEKAETLLLPRRHNTETSKCQTARALKRPRETLELVRLAEWRSGDGADARSPARSKRGGSIA